MLNIARPISEEILFGYTHPSDNQIRYREGKLPEVELHLTTSVVVADVNDLKNVDTIWHHIEKYFKEYDLRLFIHVMDRPDEMFTLLYIEETPTHTHLVFSEKTEVDPLIFISINEVDKSIPDTISIKRLKDMDTKKLTPVNLGFFADLNEPHPSISATPEECSIIVTRPCYFIWQYNDKIKNLNAYANAIYENMDLISQGIWDFQDAVKNMSLAFGIDVLGIIGLMEYEDHGTTSNGRLSCKDLYINNTTGIFHKSGLSVFLNYSAETWSVLCKYFGTALSDKYDIIDDSLFGEDDT